MLNRKLEKGKASLSDLCQLYRASSKLPGIIQSLREHTEPHAELLASRSTLTLGSILSGRVSLLCHLTDIAVSL